MAVEGLPVVAVLRAPRVPYNAGMRRPLDRIVDLLDPALNRIHGVSVEDARQRVLSGDPAAVRAIDGSFALVAVDGITVRMARSLDRPMRYFLAKRAEGPALIVADRIDTLRGALEGAGLAGQFHPSYSRMVPAHYIVELALVGCPDPDPTYTRFFAPPHGTLPADLDEIGGRYVGALAGEIAKWLQSLDARGAGEPVGVSFSGGIDSGSVFLITYHTMLALGMSPARLKAFVLDLGGGADVEQARAFLADLGLSMFLEQIEGSPDDLDVERTLRVLEDYKPLDVECAAMGLRLCQGIRDRYPDWRHLADGDGGDENLKDYPIEENPELTIRSVVDNLMLYQEGWGVGRIKHSLTYSGGLSRSYVRTYAPAAQYGFAGFSPYTRPGVVEIAEAIPFAALTKYDVPTLYSLKGEIVRRGVKAVTGIDMPIFPKRRFQHGAATVDAMRQRLGASERDYRHAFERLYA
jgi:asparagine synthase (glutamine-hydrolysing)